MTRDGRPTPERGYCRPRPTRIRIPGSSNSGAPAASHHGSLTARLLEDGVSDTGFAVTGKLLVAERPGDDAVMDEAVRLIKHRCPDLVEEIDPSEVARYFPPLGPVRRALFSPVARRVDGRILNAAISHAAVSRGVRVVSGSVTGFDRDRTDTSVVAVRTTEGTIPTGAVIVAGGAWSAEMGEALGRQLPVAPLKGQVVHLSLPDTDSGGWSIVQPVLGFYLVPWPDGRVVCGGTMEEQAGFDHRPTADGLHQLLRECLRTAPGMSQATVAEIRVGSRPVTPDGWPVLGRLPEWSNAYVATGHGTDGLLLGPYSALVIARLAMGADGSTTTAEPAIASQVLDWCSPQRFAP